MVVKVTQKDFTFTFTLEFEPCVAFKVNTARKPSFTSNFTKQ